jgi:hypothetical protein
MHKMLIIGAVAFQLFGSAVSHAEKLNSAQDLASVLISKGLPIANIEVFTPKTDPNKLMGRPGQYTSKIAFADTRYPESDSDFVGSDNTIEGFASIADAKKRADYVIRVTQSSPMFVQYVYHSGRFVLRLDRSLEPDDAKAYQAAMLAATKLPAKR